MPLAAKNRRDLTTVLTCARPGCGATFNPWKSRAKPQFYCSLACSRAAGVFARRGTWPDLPTAATAPTTPIKEWHPEPFDQARVGQDWHEAGERYEQLTAKALDQEQRCGTGRTIVLAGYGARLSIERGALIAQCGHTHTGDSAELAELYPAVHGVGRIICLGCVGSISFDAIRWCYSQDIMVTLLDNTGNLLSTLAAECPADAKLRRAQYRAADTGRDVVIARELLRRKLMGQRETIDQHPKLPNCPRAIEALGMALSWLTLDKPTPYLSTLDGLRMFEGRTARAYWGAWEGLEMRWARGEAKRVPPHWRTVGSRTSPLAPNGNGRHAVEPAYAILNYAYACLESQTRTALASRGFDLACGFLHSDKPGRDSLVYDMIEPSRGAAESLVLDFLTRTTFHAGDFSRVSDGSCRLHPQLARAVVASCRVPQARIDDHADWLKKVLLA